MDVRGLRSSAFLTRFQKSPQSYESQHFGRFELRDTGVQTLGDAEGGQEILNRLFTLMAQGKLKWQWASPAQNKENMRENTNVCFALDPQFIRPDGTKQRYGYWFFLPRLQGMNRQEGNTGILMKGEHQQDIEGIFYPVAVLDPQHFEILKAQILKALGGPL